MVAIFDPSAVQGDASCQCHTEAKICGLGGCAQPVVREDSVRLLVKEAGQQHESCVNGLLLAFLPVWSLLLPVHPVL